MRFLLLAWGVLGLVGCGAKSGLLAEEGELPGGETGAGGAGGTGVSMLAVSGGSSCALLEDGAVWCWGSGAGVGSEPTSSATPVRVEGLPEGIVAIATAGGKSCAVSAAGSVFCWGYGAESPLDPSSFSNVPVALTGLSGPATAVTVGEGHACALLSNGTIECWGSNAAGQLGTGAISDNLAEPASVLGIDDATAVVAGVTHTCALRASGALYCWGNNNFGELGTVLGSSFDPVPKEVSAVGEVAAVAPGWDHTCALRVEGTVSCWGNNFRGQLGDTTQNDNPYPNTVPGLSDVTAIDSTLDHVCAVLADGGARCWGTNLDGQMGNGESGDFAQTSPVEVVSLGAARSVAVGYHHSCAALLDGGVKCWGANDAGQLGNGEIGIDAGSSVPVEVIW